LATISNKLTYLLKTKITNYKHKHYALAYTFKLASL